MHFKEKLWIFRGIYSLSKNIYRQYILPKRENKFEYFGRHVSLETPCFITEPKSCYLGDYSAIRFGFTLINTINVNFRLGRNCVLGPHCTIITGNHAQTVGLPQIVGCKLHINDYDRDVIIRDNVWLGANVTVLAGVTIGRGAVVGANSIVTKDIPPYGVGVGNPCRVIGTVFNLEQVIKHEKEVYPSPDRMSISELEHLFYTQYYDMPTIGYETVPSNRLQDVENMINELRKYNVNKKTGMNQY